MLGGPRRAIIETVGGKMDVQWEWKNRALRANQVGRCWEPIVEARRWDLKHGDLLVDVGRIWEMDWMQRDVELEMNTAVLQGLELCKTCAGLLTYSL